MRVGFTSLNLRVTIWASRRTVTSATKFPVETETLGQGDAATSRMPLGVAVENGPSPTRTATAATSDASAAPPANQSAFGRLTSSA